MLLSYRSHRFWDGASGGFYLSGKDAEQLIAQDKDIYDGALPSGNSVAGVVLTKLSYVTGKMDYVDYVETMYASFYNDVSQQASAASFFVQSLLLTKNPTIEVVIIGDKEDPNRQQLLQKLQQTYLPNITILVGEHKTDFKRIAPFASTSDQIEGKTTVYICENFACKTPSTNPKEAYDNIVGK